MCVLFVLGQVDRLCCRDSVPRVKDLAARVLGGGVKGTVSPSTSMESETRSYLVRFERGMSRAMTGKDATASTRKASACATTSVKGPDS